MQPVFSARVLANLRTKREGGDPNDDINPDDRGPQSSISIGRGSATDIPALPPGQIEEAPKRGPDTPERSNALQSPHRRGPEAA